jgi:hypothetical protein
MRPTVVILTWAQDLHAHAVAEAIERKGGAVHMLYTPDFPARLGLSILPGRAGTTLLCHDPLPVELGPGCGSVWARRTFFAPPPAAFARGEQRTIERECRSMREGFFELLCPEAFWVNPPGGGRSKPAQLAAATRCGFRIPPTLVSNDPEAIGKFVRAAPGAVVYKTFNGLVPTTVLTEEMLAERGILRWTPGIYQEYVGKRYELRITAIGRRLFAVRINSQQTARGRIDWREAQRVARGEVGDLTFGVVKVSVEVARCCRRLMGALGLVFGAIDLIVTPGGEVVFLEVNPEGQFLWIEAATGLPLVDALAEMLVQGRVGYSWSPQAPVVRFEGELERAAEMRRREAMAEHAVGILT